MTLYETKVGLLDCLFVRFTIFRQWEPPMWAPWSQSLSFQPSSFLTMSESSLGNSLITHPLLFGAFSGSSVLSGQMPNPSLVSKSPQKAFVVLPPNRLWPTSYSRTLDAHSTPSVPGSALSQSLCPLFLHVSKYHPLRKPLPAFPRWCIYSTFFHLVDCHLSCLLLLRDSNLLKDKDHAGDLLCVGLTWRWGPS